MTEGQLRLADPGAPAVRDVVEIALPATGAYLSVLRTATAGLAARLDFTLDEIEDLRIAVDEACALLLPHAVPDSGLTATFELSDDRIDVIVTMPTRDGRLPERGTFAWTVLSALAGEVDASVDAERRVSIALHKRRALGGTAAATAGGNVGGNAGGNVGGNVGGTAGGNTAGNPAGDA